MVFRVKGNFRTATPTRRNRSAIVYALDISHTNGSHAGMSGRNRRVPMTALPALASPAIVQNAVYTAIFVSFRNVVNSVGHAGGVRT